jgi:hypothetical protein
MTFKQAHIDCKQYISSKQDPPKNQILKYVAFGEEYISMKQFFANTELISCGFTSCKILKEKCQHIINSENISMAST